MTTRPEQAPQGQPDLARQLRRLTDVELDDGDAGREAVSALVNRHIGSNLPPAALAVLPEAFDDLLIVLPDDGRPAPVRRTVSLQGGALAVDLEAVLTCLEKGATEVQVVLAAEAFLPDEQDGDPAFTLLRELKLACGPHIPLKVMLQDRVFGDDLALGQAVETAIAGGADMIGLDLQALDARGGDAALDGALRLTSMLSEIERPIGIKLRGGADVLATLDEADIVLRLARRFLGTERPAASQLRLTGQALDDAILTCLRAADGGSA